jgi:hypothetical protein
VGLVAEEFEGGEEERTWEGSEGRDIGADRNAEWLGVEARKKGFFFRGRRLAGEGEGDEILCSNFVGRSSPESLPHGGRRGRAGTGTVTLPVATSRKVTADELFPRGRWRRKKIVGDAESLKGVVFGQALLCGLRRFLGVENILLGLSLV